MSDPDLTVRSWLVDLVPDEVRLRCTYQRRRKRIVRYTVQVNWQAQWARFVRETEP